MDLNKPPVHLLISTFIIFMHFTPCISSNKSVLLSLKTEKISLSSSLPNSPNKLPFQHNVSLTVSLTVGSPPQQVSMVLDTGSELSWLHCNKATNNTVFNPQLSSSYSSVSCFSPTCKTRTRDFTVPVSCDPNSLCHVILSYADSTSVEGNLATDSFHIESVDVPGLVFGCMDIDSSSNPEDSKSTGLIGMNQGSLSFVSQMGFPQFSYCISGRDSSGVMLFGRVDFPWLGPRSYTPLVRVSTHLPYFDRVAYTVQLEGLKVSNTILSLPKSVLIPDHTGAGQTMVDSGTQFSFLLGPAYTALTNEFKRQTTGILRLLDEPEFLFQGAMDLCYRVELNRTGLPILPSVTIMLRGVEMIINGDTLLYKVHGETRESDGVYCFTFGNSDLLGVEAYIIGHHHQQNFWMEFDLEKSRVGLARIRCDLASQRLGLGP